MSEFSRRLDDYEAAANSKKSQQLQDVKQTLQEQVRQPKNNAVEGQIELDKCGPSSIQIFDGEDDGCADRKKIQQKQLRDWCSDLVVEKENARHEEQMSEQVEYVSILEKMGEESMQRKNERAKLQQLENMNMAIQAELRREMELQAKKEADATQTCYLQNCQLLTEDKKVATSQMQPHRVRPDHFKGFDKDQIHKFYKDNDAVMEDKRDKSAQEANREAVWASFQAEMLRRTDDAEVLRQQRIADDNRDYSNTLQNQREEFRVRNAKTGVAEIGAGFFERFGQSCR